MKKGQKKAKVMKELGRMRANAGPLLKIQSVT